MSGLMEAMGELLGSLGGSLDGLIDKVQSLDPTTRALLAGVAALLETNIVTGLLVPGDTVMLVASAAVASPGEGVMLAAFVSVGGLLGQISGYWMGRWVGPSFARGRWLRRRAGEQRIGPVARTIERRGGPWILISRFVPVLRTVTPFVVGVHGFPFRRFVAWSAPSCVLWSAVYVSLYSVASTSLRGEEGSSVLGGLLVLVGIVLFSGAVIAQYIFDRRHKQMLVVSEEG